MEKLALIIQGIQLATSAVQAANEARSLVEKMIAQAERDKEFTPAQVAELREKAAIAFASPASQPSGR
jgi:ribosomal protein L17